MTEQPVTSSDTPEEAAARAAAAEANPSLTNNADHIVDQSTTVADEGPPAAPEHEVDQSTTVADEGPSAAPEHEVDQSATVADEPPPPTPEHIVDASGLTTIDAATGAPITTEAPPAPAPAPPPTAPPPSAPEPPAIVEAPIPQQQPQEGTHMVQWLGVAGQPADRSELRLAEYPDKVYKPGDEVPLTPEQAESLRVAGGHHFAGDLITQTPTPKPAP